jgi:hypothetical protein
MIPMAARRCDKLISKAACVESQSTNKRVLDLIGNPATLRLTAKRAKEHPYQLLRVSGGYAFGQNSLA